MMMYGTVSVQTSLGIVTFQNFNNNKKGRTNTALPFVFED
jgi:hypothetical protein